MPKRREGSNKRQHAPPTFPTADQLVGIDQTPSIPSTTSTVPPTPPPARRSHRRHTDAPSTPATSTVPPTPPPARRSHRRRESQDVSLESLVGMGPSLPSLRTNPSIVRQPSIVPSVRPRRVNPVAVADSGDTTRYGMRTAIAGVGSKSSQMGRGQSQVTNAHQKASDPLIDLLGNDTGLASAPTPYVPPPVPPVRKPTFVAPRLSPVREEEEEEQEEEKEEEHIHIREEDKTGDTSSVPASPTRNKHGDRASDGAGQVELSNETTSTARTEIQSHDTSASPHISGDKSQSPTPHPDPNPLTSPLDRSPEPGLEDEVASEPEAQDHEGDDITSLATREYSPIMSENDFDEVEPVLVVPDGEDVEMQTIGLEDPEDTVDIPDGQGSDDENPIAIGERPAQHEDEPEITEVDGKDGYQTDSDTDDEHDIADGAETTDIQSATITILVIFCWAVVYHIPHDAYAALISIVQKSWFRPMELPKTLKGLKARRRELPLQKIYCMDVKIDVDQVASDGKDTAPFYFHSIKETIEQKILTNPQVILHCHLGPRVEEDHIEGTQHGKIQGESILGSISIYPVLTNPDIYAGSCLFIRLPQGLCILRIAEIYKRQSQTKKKDRFGSIWALVNPILIRHSDLEFYGVGTQSQKSNFAFSMLTTVESQQDEVNCYIVMAEFKIPVELLFGRANVFIKRSRNDQPRFDISAPTCEPDDQLQMALFTVKGIVVPEDDSRYDDSFIVEHFSQKPDGKDSRGRDSKDNTKSSSIASPSPVRRSGRQRSQSYNSGCGSSDSDSATTTKGPPSKRGRKSCEVSIITFTDIVDPKHLRKTMAEEELENGEVNLVELCKESDTDPIRRICLNLDWYFDEFGVFRTTHRKTGALYITPHNLDPAGRDQPRNHSVIGFVPAGGKYSECAVPLLKEMAKLAKGFKTRLLVMGDNDVEEIQEVICHVKFFSQSSDMSEANGLAGCKGPGALLPCRFCMKEKKDFRTDTMRSTNAEKFKLLRQKHITRDLREEISALRTQTERDAAYTRYGLSEDPPLIEQYVPSFNSFIQVSHDIAHAEQKGIGERMVSMLGDLLLSPVGKSEFTRVLGKFTFPNDISRKLNIVRHVKRIKMSEVTLMIACLPFMLRNMNHDLGLFRPIVLERFNLMYGDGDYDNPVYTTKTLKDRLERAFMTTAATNKLVFAQEVKRSHHVNLYDEIQRMMIASREEFNYIAHLLTFVDELPDKEEYESYLKEKKEAEKKKKPKRRTNNAGDDGDSDDERNSELRSRKVNRRPVDWKSRLRSRRVVEMDHEYDTGSETGSDDDDDADYTGTNSDHSDSDSGDEDVHDLEVAELRARTSTVNAICRLPNFHCGLEHTSTNSRLYGVRRNTSVSIGEILHKLWKSLMANCNYVDIEFMYIKHSNELSALRLLLDRIHSNEDGSEHAWCAKLIQLRQEIPVLFSNFFLGQIARNSPESGVATNTTGPATKLSLHHPTRFPDIKFGAFIVPSDAKRRGLPTKLKGRDIGRDWVLRSLWYAYVSYGFEYASVPLTFGKDVSGDLKWWESLTVYDSFNECRVRLRPGRIIGVVAGATDNEQYALILGICTHRYMKTDRVFLYICWLKDIGPDASFENRVRRFQTQKMPFERGQTQEEMSWNNIIALPTISSSKASYFVPDIQGSKGRQVFWKNDFYFASV
ncbi:hypothetical protein BJ508DRAFT_325129 [Ascobolus immersus RN42]|uniref:Uncharacterized protein n=1 Tax=Ascobolus immersus RN42 TaxID=1160509 RepID=A0A3N4IFM7_ASCIM|nr:hypothetical protein BJ508DRAFT_325129 [Ascobolus immersus RN42]